MANVILYSTACAKCKVVEMKLKQLGIDFDLVEDKDKVISVGEINGISSAPILEVDGNFYDFSNAIKYLKEVK